MWIELIELRFKSLMSLCLAWPWGLYYCDLMKVLMEEREVWCDKSGLSSDRHQPTLSSASCSILLAWLMTWRSFVLLLMEANF